MSGSPHIIVTETIKSESWLFHKHPNWTDFHLKFANQPTSHSSWNWQTDRNNLSATLHSQSQNLSNNPSFYRTVVRNLIRAAHELDTIILGGGLFEYAMDGEGRPLADGFVSSCNAIQRGVLAMSGLLLDSPGGWGYVAKVVEVLGVLVGRLVLFGDDDGDGVVTEKGRRGLRCAWRSLRRNGWVESC